MRQDENARIFEDLAADHSRYNTAVLRTQGLFLPLLDLNSQVFMAVLLLVGGYRVLQPDLPMQVGDLVGFFFMANLFFSPIPILGNQYNQALTAMAGAERLFGLLDTPPEWTDPPRCHRAANTSKDGSNFATSRSATTPSAPCCTTSTSSPSRDRRSPWSATPAAARRRSST